MVARIKRNKKSSVKSMIGYFAFSIFSICVIVFMIITNWKIYQKRVDLPERVAELKAQADQLEKQKKELEQNLSDVGTEDYLEKAAREQLDMKKPGEDVYVIQKEQEQPQQPEQENMSWWDKIKSIFIK
jgi:cell division protein FtsL